MIEYLEKPKPATTTTLLLLPAIGTSRRTLHKFGFKNGYLADVDNPYKHENAVFCLFKPEDIARFEVHLNRERQDMHFIEDYDYDGGYIVMVYNILERFKPDYELFLQGRYSEFSKDYKMQFPPIVPTLNVQTGITEDMPSIQYHILNKTETLREMRERELEIKLDPGVELWSIPDIEKETLNIDEIRIIK